MNAVTSAYLARIWLDERDRRAAHPPAPPRRPRRTSPKAPRGDGRRWRLALGAVLAIAACSWFVAQASAGGSNPQTLNVSVSGSGTVVSSPAGLECSQSCWHIYPDPTTVTLIAAPDPGWYFAGWSGAGCGQDDVCRIDLNADTWVTAVFTQDVPTPPETTITAGPGGITHDPTPRFSFSSSDSTASFICTVDTGAPESCGAEETLGPLSDGQHTLAVQATGSGGPDPTPATRSFTVRTAMVTLNGSTLTVTAARGARDNLRVTRPSPTTVQVTDLSAPGYAGSGLRAGAGCARNGDAVVACSAATLERVQVLSGDQSDRVVDATSIPGSLNGGAGSDSITGGSAADSLTGGSGADAISGMGGDDVIGARDLGSDRSIDCGGGVHDMANADALPKDPATIIHSCETVSRRAK